MPDRTGPEKAPEFAAFVRKKIDEFGVRGLQRETGVAHSSLRNIRDTEAQPEMETLLRFSERFKIPLWRLIEMCGYDLQLPVSNDVLAKKITSLAESMPDLRPVLEYLLELDPSDLQGVVVFLEVQQRRRQDA